jgi:lipid IVA palmitoyltransferase
MYSLLNTLSLSIKPLLTLAASTMLLLPSIALADAQADESTKTSIISHVQDTVVKTWQSTEYELYIPINTWHNRNYYSAEKIDSFNEQPWGLGIGKYRYDEDGDWHGIYGMAFLDSHNNIEPVFGYGFQKVWQSSENVQLGLGYTAGVTVRTDLDHLAAPLLLPLFSIQYKDVAVQSTYIPGGQGYGNILFTWLRWQM